MAHPVTFQRDGRTRTGGPDKSDARGGGRGRGRGHLHKLGFLPNVLRPRVHLGCIRVAESIPHIYFTK